MNIAHHRAALQAIPGLAVEDAQRMAHAFERQFREQETRLRRRNDPRVEAAAAGWSEAYDELARIFAEEWRRSPLRSEPGPMVERGLFLLDADRRSPRPSVALALLGWAHA